jgi:uncharacterized membrane protein YhaH (DUF805 family)
MATVMGVQFLSMGLLTLLVAGFVNSSTEITDSNILMGLPAVMQIAINLITIPFAVSTVAILSQRARDIGVSGWFVTLAFAPVFGLFGIAGWLSTQETIEKSTGMTVIAIVLLVSIAISLLTHLWLIFWPGQKCDNRFGPVEKDT